MGNQSSRPTEHDVCIHRGYNFARRHLDEQRQQEDNRNQRTYDSNIQAEEAREANRERLANLTDEERDRIRQESKKRQAELNKQFTACTTCCCILGGIACMAGGGYGVHTLGCGFKASTAQWISTWATICGPCCFVTGTGISCITDEKKDEIVITTQPTRKPVSYGSANI